MSDIYKMKTLNRPKIHCTFNTQEIPVMMWLPV
jgi:hypothetical protein